MSVDPGLVATVPDGSGGSHSSGGVGGNGGSSGSESVGNTLNHAVGILSSSSRKRMGSAPSVGWHRREVAHERGRIFGAHECFTDEHGVEANRGHAVCVFD